ncbi:MAG: ChbG/HpnK family deacetylase [Kiritimatiellaceae bacterium]|nr:ChbG/HpnK family deacetylase [Kiritimatiellaceae bacterium]
MGLNHASNAGCQLTYMQGITTAIEVMAPCPYFMEAVSMLKGVENIELGIHLTLNAEWTNYKWRPLTHCPSITDANGYFFKQVWNKKEKAVSDALNDQKWDINEIERELRAQIELILNHLPQTNHITLHMGFSSCGDIIETCIRKLAAEYRLIYWGNEYRNSNWGKKQNVTQIRFWDDKSDTTVGLAVKATLKTLSELKPGNYIFIDHPAQNTEEMQSLGYSADDNVASKRETVTNVLTNLEVIKYIREHDHIRLVGYGDFE